MIYVKFYGDASYVGTDYEDYQTFEDETSRNTLIQIAEDIGQDNAEMYEYLATDYMENLEDEDEREQLIEDYYDNCFYDYEIISKEEYEGEMY